MYKMNLRGHDAQLILFATLIKFLLCKKQFFMRFFFFGFWFVCLFFLFQLFCFKLSFISIIFAAQFLLLQMLFFSFVQSTERYLAIGFLYFPTFLYFTFAFFISIFISIC